MKSPCSCRVWTKNKWWNRHLLSTKVLRDEYGKNKERAWTRWMSLKCRVKVCGVNILSLVVGTLLSYSSVISLGATLAVTSLKVRASQYSVGWSFSTPLYLGLGDTWLGLSKDSYSLVGQWHDIQHREGPLSENRFSCRRLWPDVDRRLNCCFQLLKLPWSNDLLRRHEIYSTVSIQNCLGNDLGRKWGRFTPSCVGCQYQDISITRRFHLLRSLVGMRCPLQAWQTCSAVPVMTVD